MKTRGQTIKLSVPEPDRKGKKYDKRDDVTLDALVKERFDTRTIAAYMHRTYSGISGAMSKRKLSLKAARGDLSAAEAVARKLHIDKGYLRVSMG